MNANERKSLAQTMEKVTGLRWCYHCTSHLPIARFARDKNHKRCDGCLDKRAARDKLIRASQGK